MKEPNNADCNCQKSREHHCTGEYECQCKCSCDCNGTSHCDCHRFHSCCRNQYNNRCHSCCRNQCHNRCHSCCRRDLCNKDFQINLAGLTDGLNYRLHQLLWNQVTVVLDKKVKKIGTIVFIGSNFIELLIEPKHAPTEDTDQVASETLDESEKRDHKKGDSWIIPINKIKTVKSKFLYKN